MLHSCRLLSHLLRHNLPIIMGSESTVCFCSLDYHKAEPAALVNGKTNGCTVVDKLVWLCYSRLCYLLIIFATFLILANEQSTKPTGFFQWVSTVHTYIVENAYPHLDTLEYQGFRKDDTHL